MIPKEKELKKTRKRKKKRDVCVAVEGVEREVRARMIRIGYIYQTDEKNGK